MNEVSVCVKTQTLRAELRGRRILQVCMVLSTGLVSLYTKGLLVPVCTSYLFVTQSIIIHVDLRTKGTLLSR